MLNHMTINKPAEATAVLAWSSVDFDYDQGIEYLRHYVSFCDDDLEPIGKRIEFFDVNKAENYGYNLAGRYGLDLETDFIWRLSRSFFLSGRLGQSLARNGRLWPAGAGISGAVGGRVHKKRPPVGGLFFIPPTNFCKYIDTDNFIV